MLRCLTFLSFCCLFSAWAIAQVTYQQSDFAAPGDTFVLSQTSPLPGLGLNQDGSGLTWDVSTLSPNGQRVARFGDPDQAGYRLTWISQCIFQGGSPFSCPSEWDALTNLSEDVLNQASALFDLLPLTLSDRTRHYRLGNDYLIERLLGLSVGTTFPIPLIVAYSQPDTLLTFPMSLGLQDSSVAAYAIDYTSLGVPFASYTELKRVRNVSAEGSLTTPFATYPQVVKLETSIEQKDSLIYAPDSSVVINRNRVEYQWFDPAQGHPVMIARGNVILGLPVLTELEYLDTLRCIEPSAFFIALPNPVIYDNQNGSATVTLTSVVQNADSLHWDLQDGSTADAQILLHSFAQPGVYPVELVACNTFCHPPQCDTFVLPVTVVDTTQPLAFFNADPTETCEGFPIDFVNNSFNAETYYWDFGDGDTSSQENPSHAYAQAGSYTVTLVVSRNGNADTAAQSVSIRPQPSVSIGPDTTVVQGQSLLLQSNLQGGPASYAWTPAQGLSCTACPNPSAQPDTSTTYRLVVTNSCGQDTATLRIEITPQVGLAPQATAGYRYFPNPTPGPLTVVWSEPTRLRWRLTDLLGRTLRQGQAEGDRFRLDFSELTPGIYALELRGEHTSRQLIRIE
jgi:PKD repeat protein